MIELAPRSKYGLTLSSPVMPATGTMGYGQAYPDLVDLGLIGAVVTNPVSLRPRRAAKGQRIGVRGEHVIVHTGWPNSGLRRVVREAGSVWERLPLPVIVHVLATQSADVGRAAATLSGVPGVRGMELGFADDVVAERACEMVAAAVGEGALPVLAKVPFGRVQDLAPELVDAGADAVTLVAAPRGVLPAGVDKADGGVARFLRGRMYGPALFPLLLQVLARWAAKLEVPVVACGGITSAKDALTCLTLGAAAVQVDALMWRDPSLLNAVGRGLMEDAGQWRGSDGEGGVE